MSATRTNYNKQIISNARHWLKKQPADLSKCINSTDKALKAYLKSQQAKEDKMNSPQKGNLFKKELKKYCGIEFHEDKPLKGVALDASGATAASDLPENQALASINNEELAAYSLEPAPKKPFESLLEPPPLQERSLESLDSSKKTNNSPPASKSKINPMILKKDNLESLALEENNSSHLASEEINPLISLDSKSRQIVEQTKRQLNLSQPEEALKALIQLGYKSIKSLIS